jgi:DNA-binding CsgD family transcriptional regulator
MGRAGRPVAELVLTEQERETLQRWARRLKSSQALAQRCRIVLGCAAGKSNKEVATEVGVWSQTVCKWRQRFVESRLEGLADEPRPGAPRTITDEQIEEVIVATLERQPSDTTHWSRASRPPRPDCPSRLWAGSGKRSGSSHIRSAPSRSAMIHSS